MKCLLSLRFRVAILEPNHTTRCCSLKTIWSTTTPSRALSTFKCATISSTNTGLSKVITNINHKSLFSFSISEKNHSSSCQDNCSPKRMTNKPILALRQQNANPSDTCTTKSKLHTSNQVQRGNLEIPRRHTLAESTNFRTMAGIQKLAIEPTREHIENIRHDLRIINAKNNDDQQITLDKDLASGIATVCIKSAAKNGISGKMMCDFLDIIDELYTWNEGKGVIIHGHQGFFCSGGDLVTVREMANYEDGLKMATLMQYNLTKLQTLPMITMSFIEGKAIGGGAEIAVATDLRVITKSAKIGYVHCRVGIVAAWGGGSRLVQLVGPSRAVELMSSGRLVGSDEAMSLGLVNHVIEDTNLELSQVMEKAKDYLRGHLVGAKSTIIAIKSLVNAARTLPLEQALVVEGQILSSTWGKQPHLDALNNNIRHRDC